MNPRAAIGLLKDTFAQWQEDKAACLAAGLWGVVAGESPPRKGPSEFSRAADREAAGHLRAGAGRGA